MIIFLNNCKLKRKTQNTCLIVFAKITNGKKEEKYKYTYTQKLYYFKIKK